MNLGVINKSSLFILKKYGPKKEDKIMDSNIILLNGRCSNTPKISNGENPSVRFSLAVNRQGENAGADFVPCVAFKKVADYIIRMINAGLFHSGSSATIVGSFRTGSYDKPDGNKVYTYECLINNITIYEPLKDNSQQNAPQQNPNNVSSQGAFSGGFSQGNQSNQYQQQAPNSNQSAPFTNNVPTQQPTNNSFGPFGQQNESPFPYGNIGEGLPWAK